MKENTLDTEINYRKQRGETDRDIESDIKMQRRKMRIRGDKN